MSRKHLLRRFHAKHARKWIKGAIGKHRGELKHEVRREFGRGGFTERGTIKVETLRRIAKRKTAMGKRAQVALTLRKLRRKGG